MRKSFQELHLISLTEAQDIGRRKRNFYITSFLDKIRKQSRLGKTLTEADHLFSFEEARMVQQQFLKCETPKLDKASILSLIRLGMISIKTVNGLRCSIEETTLLM